MWIPVEIRTALETHLSHVAYQLIVEQCKSRSLLQLQHLDRFTWGSEDVTPSNRQCPWSNAQRRLSTKNGSQVLTQPLTSLSSPLTEKQSSTVRLLNSA